MLEQHLTIRQAAEIMGISERHTKRLLAAYRKEGVAALTHGNRGRRPHNAVPEEAAAAVVKWRAESVWRLPWLTEAEGLLVSQRTHS